MSHNPVILSIDGMSCDGCVRGLTQALQAHHGISEVSVTRDPAEAHLNYDSSIITLSEIFSIVEDAGFKVTGTNA